MEATGNKLGAIDKLPYEIWSSVFVWLARKSTTAQLLATRLVCRLFDSVVREERTAYQAVLAGLGHLLRNNEGQVIQRSDCPVASWWAVLMDQVRLDRTWIGALTLSRVDSPGEAAPVRPPPGYEVTTLSHTAHDKYDVLLYYDWVCATVDPIDESKPSNGERGAIGFLAHRKRLQIKRNHKRKRKQARSIRYLAVHIVDYPSLQPIVTHTFVHRGWWGIDPADLPRASHVNDNHILSVNAPWIATLLLVDYKRKQYALAYTDEHGVSELVLRSYAENAPSNGKTVGSFIFERRSNGTILRIVDDNTYRFCFIDNIGDSYTHMRLLSRATLAPISNVTIPIETNLFEHSPDHNRNLLMVTSTRGEASFWDVTTGRLQEWIQATPGNRPHVMFLRPMFRPGLLTESPPPSHTTRTGTPDLSSATAPCPIHEQRPWIQLIIGWPNCRPGLEHCPQNSGACLFNISSLPLAPRTSMDQLTAAPADRSPYPQNQGIRSMSMILGTPFLAGDITGHLMAVLQPNGRVVMIDLRTHSLPVESLSKPVADGDPPSKQTAGLQPVKTTPLWLMSLATREYAVVHGELMNVPLPVNGRARTRALGKTNLKLVARRVHGDALQGVADLIERGHHRAAMSADRHSPCNAPQVVAVEDGVADASDGKWTDDQEVTEIASSSSQWKVEADISHGNEESGTHWSDVNGNKFEEEREQDKWPHEHAGNLMFLGSRGDAMLVHRGANLVLLRRVQR